MANSAQARKRARQAGQTNKHNASLRSSLRTAVKLVSEGDRGRRQGRGDGKAQGVRRPSSIASRTRRSFTRTWHRGRSRVSPTPSRPWPDAFAVPERGRLGRPFSLLRHPASPCLGARAEAPAFRRLLRRSMSCDLHRHAYCFNAPVALPLAVGAFLREVPRSRRPRWQGARR